MLSDTVITSLQEEVLQLLREVVRAGDKLLDLLDKLKRGKLIVEGEYPYTSHLDAPERRSDLFRTYAHSVWFETVYLRHDLDKVAGITEEQTLRDLQACYRFILSKVDRIVGWLEGLKEKH